ncbi:MAG: TonB-dependent receptor [Bacteroidales bacterium]|nr:TonB-dependent receptor [Bacteroidales bacterium]
MIKKLIQPLYLLAPLCLLAPAMAAAQADSVSTALREVVVTGTRAPADASRIPLSVTVISQQQLEQKHLNSVLPTVAELSPGVFVTRRGVLGYDVTSGAAGGINIRGLSGSDGRVMVLIDGHPQYNGVYSHPISDSYQTLMAERVEVVRTPSSVIYGGNAMGGVINIITRNAHRHGWSGTAQVSGGSYGTVEAQAAANYKSDRAWVSASGSYGRSDNHRPHMEFSQWTGYLKGGYRFSEHWTASATADVTHFNSQYPGTVSQPMLEALRWITRGVAQVSIDNSYGKTSGSLSAYCNFGRHKVNDGYRVDGGTPQTDYFRSKDALAGVNLWQAFSPIDGAHITVGLDYQHIYGRAYYTDRATGEVVTTPRRLMQSAHGHANEIAAYADWRQDLGTLFSIEAGLRYDWHSVTKGQVVPMGGVAWNVNPHSQLKATTSKGFRNPTYKELYMYGTANEDLDPESLIEYELSWNQALGAFSYGASAYYMRGSNLIVQGVVIDDDGNEVSRNINTGKVRNWGAELWMAWDISQHFTVATNHSVLHMKNHIIGAPEYKGYLSGSWHQGRWSATVGLTQLSGLFIAEDSKENATLLDVTVDFAVSRSLTLWVRGDNLLAQRYQLIQGLPMPKATFMGGLTLNF